MTYCRRPHRGTPKPPPPSLKETLSRPSSSKPPSTLDNFSEDEHTPYVHTRLGWDDSHADQVAFEARNLEDRTEVSYRAPQRPAPLIKLLANSGNQLQAEIIIDINWVRTGFVFHRLDVNALWFCPLQSRDLLLQ